MNEADNYDTTTASGVHRRSILGRTAAALLAGTATALAIRQADAAPSVAAGDDAELILWCDRLVSWEARYDAIYLSIADDDEANAAAMMIRPKFEEIRDRLYAIGLPKTLDGQRALARAALATAQRTNTGEIILDDGGSIASYLAFGLAHSLAGSAAA